MSFSGFLSKLTPVDLDKELVEVKGKKLIQIRLGIA
jgi:hypothetical protein